MIINFWGNLKELLRPPFRGQKRVEYELSRQASVKDIVEALGVPHTEVGRLTVAGREISFAAPGTVAGTFDVYPLSPLWMYRSQPCCGPSLYLSSPLPWI